MKFRCLKLHVLTTDGPYGATQDFPDGLVVIWADNSMGKSTCAKAILVALGMEAMLTTSQQDLPLPPAVKTQLDSPDGAFAVLESEVFLEIENHKRQRIVVQRTIKGARDKNLITVHEGPVLSSPGTSVPTRDLFVSRQGAATREHGFHHYLATFLDWSLPAVQTYDGNEYPLYMQCVFPYFVVEQTRGWSTLQPPLPTHFRLRDANKRVVEFLLNLDAHQIALRRQELQLEKTRIESAWSTELARVKDLAERVGGTLQGLPHHPLAGWPLQVLPTIAVPVGDAWLTIEQRTEERKTRLSELLATEVPKVGEISESAQVELAESDKKVRNEQTLLARLMDSLEMEEQEVRRIEERLAAIDEDIQRNKDVRTLRQLGSRKDSAIDAGACPVCHQAISDSLVPLAIEQVVMSVDENIQFLTSQRHTFDVVLENARRVAASRQQQVRALREELSSTRERVRVLRQTLVADNRLPSVAAIQARVELESAFRRDEEARNLFGEMLGRFEPLADRWRAYQTALQELPREDATDLDKEKIAAWTSSLRSQLSQYGFKSFDPNQISISSDTYKPEHGGFELSFDLQTSISASDLVRTIWSYLCGLLEIARTLRTNHPGCIIFDEPKQQSTKDVSFAELLRRASNAGQYGQQVIFFTSESRDRLNSHLSDIPHTLHPIEGRIIKKT